MHMPKGNDGSISQVLLELLECVDNVRAFGRWLGRVGCRNQSNAHKDKQSRRNDCFHLPFLPI
jgi:hypothetical protein